RSPGVSVLSFSRTFSSSLACLIRRFRNSWLFSVALGMGGAFRLSMAMPTGSWMNSPSIMTPTLHQKVFLGLSCLLEELVFELAKSTVLNMCISPRVGLVSYRVVVRFRESESELVIVESDVISHSLSQSHSL